MALLFPFLFSFKLFSCSGHIIIIFFNVTIVTPHPDLMPLEVSLCTENIFQSHTFTQSSPFLSPATISPADCAPVLPAPHCAISCQTLFCSKAFSNDKLPFPSVQSPQFSSIYKSDSESQWSQLHHQPLRHTILTFIVGPSLVLFH